MDMEEKDKVTYLSKEITLTDLISKVWVKQLYLDCEKENRVHEGKIYLYYSWGFRAEREFKKEKLLDFVAKIYGCQPQQFKQQWMAIHGEVPSTQTSSQASVQVSQPRSPNGALAENQHPSSQSSNRTLRARSSQN